MIYALIFAGGTGQRMNSRAKPKQFLELHGKPIILYTVGHFERHPAIDGIVIVCIEDWIDELAMFLRRHEYKKVLRIVPGGVTGHESTYLGLKSMSEICGGDDIVLIHDGVRPLITKDLITANIEKVQECGTAITVNHVIESIITTSDGSRIDNIPDRSSLFTAKAPQSFRFGMIWNYYQKAHEEGLSSIDSAQLLCQYGVEMHTVLGPSYNIKITAPVDYYIFRALYEAMENTQVVWGIEL